MVNEKRLICVDDAIKKLETEITDCEPVYEDDSPFIRFKKRLIPKLVRNVIDWLLKQPTVDAVEVVHGRWDIKVGMNYNKERICPVCNKQIESNYWNYCPNCGAKMDGGNEDG